MNEQARGGKAQIEREARDAVASRVSGSGSDARQAAMRRYLGAETYHEKRLEDAEAAHDGEHDGTDRSADES